MLDSFQCPVTRATMVAPVVCADGQVYDRSGIQSWFDRGFTTSPMTNTSLPHLGLLPVPAFKNAIAEFVAWKKECEEEKNDGNIEMALLRSRVEQLENEKLLLDKERAGMSITKRELAHEYKELATLRTEVQEEKAWLATKRKIVEGANDDLQRLGRDIKSLEQEKEALGQTIRFLSSRAMEMRAANKATLLEKMCENYLNGSAVQEREGDAATSWEDGAGKKRKVLRRVVLH